MGLPIKENRLPIQGPHKIYITYKTLRLLPYTKPQNKVTFALFAKFLPPEKWPSLTPSASQSFHLLAVFQISFSPKCANLKLSQWIWFEFDKSQRRKKMQVYLTSAVTHLNFFYIM